VSPVSLSVLGVNLQYPPMHDTSDSAMNTEDRGIAADHAFEKGGSAGFDHFSPLLDTMNQRTALMIGPATRFYP